MARENQGLQIALIVFVMLTIILGVTSYLFFKQYQTAWAEAQKNLEDRNAQAKLAGEKGTEADTLKRLIIGPSQDSAETVGAQFKDDMRKYAGAYQEEFHFYRPLLEKVEKTLADKNDALQKAQKDLEAFKALFIGREASKDPEIKGFQEAADKAQKHDEKESADFITRRDQIVAEQTKIQADLNRVQKESKAALDKEAANSAGLQGQLVSLTKDYDQKSAKLNKMTAENFDAPLGEVRWVNQRTGTAWINLGRADSLVRQVSFSVFPADITNLTLSAKKASIEVTQFLGAHLAETRITDDKPDDPIMPGDKIYTPIWSPYQPRHFALTGFLDMDGDGKSDLATLRDLITMNGGVVDSYLNEKGEIVGQMTINTRYLVCGAKFEEADQDPQRKGDTAMTKTAARLGVPSISLDDLLERMGWKNPTRVVRYGKGLNIKDFAPKAPPGPQIKSTGSVFLPRQPSDRSDRNAEH